MTQAHSDAGGISDGGGDTGTSDGDEAVRRTEEVPEDVVSGGHDVITSEVEGTLERVSCDLLEGYRDRGDCVLAEAGFIDLLGNTWACVIEGTGWVEVCTVRALPEEGDFAFCRVTLLRLDADEVSRTLGVGVGSDGGELE